MKQKLKAGKIKGELYSFLAGYSPLHHAATWGRTECLKVLIEAGADLQQRTNYGERARECAVRYGQQECIELIDISGTKIFNT